MTGKEIFHKYYKKKLLLWGTVAIVAIVGRIIGGHQTSWLLAVGYVLTVLIVALLLGYGDYHFREKKSPALIKGLLDAEPLLQFQNIGFLKEEDASLYGHINNYEINLSPIIGTSNEKWLLIMIPIQPREGLEDYISKYQDNFKLIASGNMLFMEGRYKDYIQNFMGDSLMKLLQKITSALKDDKIEPVKYIYSV